jgi:hypothetical protein
MYERIAAVHPAVAETMSHIDLSREPRLERVLSEIRTHRKRLASDRTGAHADASPGLTGLG